MSKAIPMLVEHFSLDPDVQDFVADEVCARLWPFVKPKTARQIFQDARRKFGDHRCLDLTIHVH
jgi:hypothetical protein